MPVSIPTRIACAVAAVAVPAIILTGCGSGGTETVTSTVTATETTTATTTETTTAASVTTSIAVMIAAPR